jgi:hypothetical protein
MKSAQKHEPTAYETFCDQLRTLAKSEERIMSESEIHRSARNLMGYVEWMIRHNSKELMENE